MRTANQKSTGAEVVRAAQAGQEDAFFELVRRYAPALTSFMRSYLRNPEDAEDVAQEAFARAFMKIAELREPEHFTSWLWRIAHCAAIDRRRKTVREAATFDPAAAELLDDNPASEPRAGHWLERECLVAEVREALDSLPPLARQILFLRYRDELSYEQIAQRTGLTLIQVKARLARARGKLRRPLEPLVHDWKRLQNELP